MKVMTIFGTRPEGIKMAPLVNALKSDSELECIVVNTGQHREMLDQVLSLFSIKPDYDLNVMEAGQTPENITINILEELSFILDKEKPDLVLVHGDTTTTFVGAYASFLKQIPVGHVEAGLRTYNKYSPFPEEVNRQLVSRIATLHFAATEDNKNNLLKENINEKNIFVTGNTVIDSLLHITNRQFDFPDDLMTFLNNGRKTILVTTHRRENLDQLQFVYEGINRILEKHNDVQVLFPIHKNPVVRKQVSSYLKKNERVVLSEPMDYETFSHSMKKCFLIITDSGGIQEEAPALGKPVLVARNTTERQEGVEAGTLKLVGTSSDSIFEECDKLLKNEDYYNSTSQTMNPYGQGKSSEAIVQFIKRYLKM